jgi:hypothetical protein
LSKFLNNFAILTFSQNIYFFVTKVYTTSVLRKRGKQIMKKLLMLLALGLVLVFTACQADEGKSEDTNEDATNAGESNEDADAKELKSALVKNQIELVFDVRPSQQAINAYVAELAKPAEEAADAETVEGLKADALAAAEEAVAAIDAFELQGELTEDAKASFEAAIADLKASYEAYVTAISADETDFTAAEESFTSFNDKLGELFESAGLLKTDMSKELA